MKPTITTNGLEIGTYLKFNNDIFVIDGIKDFENSINVHLADMFENGDWYTYDPLRMTLIANEELENHYQNNAEKWIKDNNIVLTHPVKLVRLAGTYKAFGGPKTLPIGLIKPYLGMIATIVRIDVNYDFRIKFEDGSEFLVPFFCLEPVKLVIGDFIDITPLEGLCPLIQFSVTEDEKGKLYTYRIDYSTRTELVKTVNVYEKGV